MLRLINATFSLVIITLSATSAKADNLSRIEGEWNNETGYNIVIEPDQIGGWNIRLPDGEGTIVPDGTGGGNIRVSSENMNCNYRATFLADGRMNWLLIKGPDQSCLKGYFVYVPSSHGRQIERFSDTAIRQRPIKPDYTETEMFTNNQVFVYEAPVYGYVDGAAPGGGRVTVRYSACVEDHTTSIAQCNPQAAARKFCALQGLKSALVSGTDQVVFINDLSSTWLWNIQEGRTIRKFVPSDQYVLPYFNKVGCKQ